MQSGKSGFLIYAQWDELELYNYIYELIRAQKASKHARFNGSCTCCYCDDDPNQLYYTNLDQSGFTVVIPVLSSFPSPRLRLSPLLCIRSILSFSLLFPSLSREGLPV